MKAVTSGLLTAAAVLMFTGTAFAQAATDAKTVNINAQVNAKAKLTVGPGTVSFPDDDPDTSSVLTSATVINVTVKARTSAAGNVTLTVLSDDDLLSGTDAIAIDNLTWTATGDLLGGTMDKTTAASLGSWTGSGTKTGAQTYKLVNSWDYVTGTYTAIITYTLTAP